MLGLSALACEEPLIVTGDLPGFMRVVAGVPDSIGNRSSATALATLLRRPGAIAAAADGTLYVADESARLLHITPGGALTVLHDTKGCPLDTCLLRPRAMTLSADASALLIADDLSDRVWRFTLATRELVSIAGNGTRQLSADGVRAAEASLAEPLGVATLRDGTVLIAERGSNKVRAVGADGVLRTFAASLAEPYGITVADGEVYVSAAGSAAVYAIDTVSGEIRRVAGNGVAGFSGDGGSAVNAALNVPSALVVIGANLYIIDRDNHRVRLVNLQTGIITTFAGDGSRTFNGNGRAAGETALDTPAALAASPSGLLFLADAGHQIVWRTPVLLRR